MTSLLVALALAFSQDKSLVCAVQPDMKVNSLSAGVEYRGAKFTFCCGDCHGAFERDPARFVSEAADAGRTVGTFLFDPVTGERVDIKKSTFTSDYKGLRYTFKSADEKTTFDATPDKFTTIPDKECLTCPISGEKVRDYGSSAGYVDYDGARYYACCSSCLPQMQKDMASAVKGKDLPLGVPVAVMGRNNTPKGM